MGIKTNNKRTQQLNAKLKEAKWVMMQDETKPLNMK
jgi:hypothetical protein